MVFLLLLVKCSMSLEEPPRLYVVGIFEYLSVENYHRVDSQYGPQHPAVETMGIVLADRGARVLDQCSVDTGFILDEAE